MINDETSLRDKAMALGILLREAVEPALGAATPGLAALSACLADPLLLEHSYARVLAPFKDWLLLSVLVGLPILLLVAAVWKAHAEYLQILQGRAQP